MKRVIFILLLAMLFLAVGSSSAYAEASSDDNSPKPGEVYTVGSEDIPAYQCWWYIKSTSKLFSCGENQQFTLLSEGEEIEVLNSVITHWLWSRVKVKSTGETWWIWSSSLEP